MLEHLFRISIFRTKVKDWKDHKLELLSMLDEVESLQDHQSDYKTHFSKDIKPKYTQKLMRVLDGAFCEFEDVFPYAYEIKNLWCQRYKDNQFHGTHNHGAVGYSMVFYAQFDKNCHQGTTFISPFNNWLNGNAIYHTIDVDEGDVVFFPSFILHECIPVKNNDKERIIFSLNMNVEEPKS